MIEIVRTQPQHDLTRGILQIKHCRFSAELKIGRILDPIMQTGMAGKTSANVLEAPPEGIAG